MGITRWWRSGRRVALVVWFVVVGYLAVTAGQVWSVAQRDDRRPAGAIVVLGAAQYDGVPSPVFRSRLEHTLELWRDGVAPVVVVTGGGQPGDRSNEAAAAADFLLRQGVGEAAILREVDARTTYESLQASARLLRRRGITDAVLVSSPTHALRSLEIAEDVGLDAAVSSTRLGDVSLLTSLRWGIRETFAVAAGRLVGHRRVPRIAQLVGA